MKKHQAQLHQHQHQIDIQHYRHEIELHEIAEENRKRVIEAKMANLKLMQFQFVS